MSFQKKRHRHGGDSSLNLISRWCKATTRASPTPTPSPPRPRGPACTGTRTARAGEKDVRLAQEMQVGPCIPAWRLSIGLCWRLSHCSKLSGRALQQRRAHKKHHTKPTRRGALTRELMRFLSDDAATAMRLALSAPLSRKRLAFSIQSKRLAFSIQAL